MRSIQKIGFSLALVLPVFLVITLIYCYGVNFPFWDDWAYAMGVTSWLQTPSPDFDYLLARHGVHVVLFAKLSYYLLGRFADWNLVVGMYANVALGMLVFMGLAMLLRKTTRGIPGSWIFYPLASFYTFSLTQWPLYFSVWGQVWLLLPLFLRVGMLLIESKVSFNILVISLIVLAMASSMTMVAGFAIWIAFPISVIFSGITRRSLQNSTMWWSAGIWVFAAFAASWFILRDYGSVSQFDAIANFMAEKNNEQFSPLVACLQQPVRAVMFFLGFLGASAGGGVDQLLGGTYWHEGIAISFGLLGVVAYAGIVIWLVAAKRSKQLLSRLNPWLVIGAVEMIQAALTTVGRIGGYGIERALSPHYGHVGLQFLFAIGVGCFLTWNDIIEASETCNDMGLIRKRCIRYGGRVLVFFGCLLFALQMFSQRTSFSEIVRHSEQLRYERSSAYFAHAISEEDLPDMLKRTGFERLEFYSDRGVFNVASSQKIELMKKSAKPIRWAGVSDWKSFTQVSKLDHQGITRIDGYFADDVTSLFDDFRSVILELKCLDGATRSLVLPARRKKSTWSGLPVSLQHINFTEGGGVFKFHLAVSNTRFAGSIISKAFVIKVDDSRLDLAF